MSRVKVFLEGQFVAACELLEQEPFIFGRGEHCHFRLETFPGISREHFRIRKIDGSWILEVLSRYGELYVNGQKQSGLGLVQGAKFSVPPYEFEFEQTEVADTASSEERTEVKQVPSVPFLKIIDAKGQSLGKFKLEGDEWVCGRDTHHAIYLGHPKVSREQFVIQRQEHSYLLKNLSRSNPTKLNGKPISDSGWSSLVSGDIIQVADIQFFFDLVDMQFSERIASLDSVPIQEIVGSEAQSAAFLDQDAARRHLYEQGSSYQESHQASIPVASLRVLRFGSFEIELNRKNIFRFVIVGIIFVALILNSLTNQETKTSGSNPSNLVKPFDRLPADQQDIVRQAYSAAQLLLAQGRYELTKQELAKIHRLIPFYEDSKQMEETADQGLLIAQERERLAAEERERAEINDKIQAQLMQCQSLLRPEVTLEEFESCVLPVLQFDPEHSAIREMRDRVIGFIAERESRAARQREHAGRVRALHELFKRAEQIEKEGRAIPTINAYRRVVTSRLPDPNGLKRLASEKIKEVSAQLESLQAKSEQESEEARKAGNYRRAILIIREALKFNPENEVLKSRHVQLMKELTNLMMTLYQEGVLEESIGNVEAAKAQWQKIRTQSLAGEEYFVRATIKLQRYGAIRDEF